MKTYLVTISASSVVAVQADTADEAVANVRESTNAGELSVDEVSVQSWKEDGQ